MSQLKDRYRRLVELQYFEEKSYEEISGELNLPMGTEGPTLRRDMMAKVPILAKRFGPHDGF